MKSNIKTISELTGFSQATISNVLNNKKNVKKSTADLIIQTAYKIGYLIPIKSKMFELLCIKNRARFLRKHH